MVFDTLFFVHIEFIIGSYFTITDSSQIYHVCENFVDKYFNYLSFPQFF